MKNNEIELKLRLRQDFFLKTPAVLSPFKAYFQGEQDLINTYYDTDNRALANQKSILRTRQCGNKYTLTVKLPGTVTGGLHAHPEYNITLNNNKLDLNALKKQFNLNLPCSDHDLKPLFQTNFLRKIWLVPFAQSTIEIALDKGVIVSPLTTQKEQICELELELKDGQAVAILAFTYQNISENGAMLSSTNKAKRGYWLALGEQTQMNDYLMKWEKILALPLFEQMPAILSFEQEVIENACQLGQDYFFQDFTRTVKLISAFFNLYTYITDIKMGQYLTSTLEQLAPGVLQAFSPTLVNDFASFNQYGYQQIQQIMQEHSQTRDNQKAIQALWDWLYCNVQLKRLLIEMLLALNEKNGRT